MTDCGDGCTAPSILKTTELHAVAGRIEGCMFPSKAAIFRNEQLLHDMAICENPHFYPQRIEVHSLRHRAGSSLWLETQAGRSRRRVRSSSGRVFPEVPCHLPAVRRSH